jgi:hypothetical protein
MSEELRGYDAWKTWSAEEDNRCSPDPECVHCEEEFPREQLNERGFCARCARNHDDRDPNFDPTPMTMGEWDGGFAENH